MSTPIQLPYPDGGEVLRVLRNPSNGLPWDLSGIRDLECTFSEGAPGPDQSLRLTIRGTVIDAPGGLVSFNVSRNQTIGLGEGNYYAQARWVTPEDVTRVSEVFLAQVAPSLVDAPDRTRPLIQLLSHPADITLDAGTTEVVFYGTIADDGGILEFRINGTLKDQVDGNFNVTLPVDDGANIFILTALDASGNPADPVSRTITVDVAPAPGVLALVSGSYQPMAYNDMLNVNVIGAAWSLDAVDYDQNDAGAHGFWFRGKDNGGALDLTVAAVNTELSDTQPDPGTPFALALYTDGSGNKKTVLADMSEALFTSELSTLDSLATLDYWVDDAMLAPVDAGSWWTVRDPNDILTAASFASGDPTLVESAVGTVQTFGAQAMTLAGDLYDHIPDPPNPDTTNSVFFLDATISSPVLATIGTPIDVASVITGTERIGVFLVAFPAVGPTTNMTAYGQQGNYLAQRQAIASIGGVIKFFFDDVFRYGGLDAAWDYNGP